MAWDFSTDPQFQEKLDWVERFCQEKVEPLDYVFPHAVRWPDPVVKAYVRELQQEVKDQGLWAIFLDEELGGPGYGQLKLGLLNEIVPDVATLQRRADETAKLVAGNAPITLEVTKEAVRRIRRTLTRDEGEDLIVRAYMSEDFREGMDAFLNKRTPNWKGK